jgi:hypothetical protein
MIRHQLAKNRPKPGVRIGADENAADCSGTDSGRITRLEVIVMNEPFGQLLQPPPASNWRCRHPAVRADPEVGRQIGV